MPLRLETLRSANISHFFLLRQRKDYLGQDEEKLHVPKELADFFSQSELFPCTPWNFIQYFNVLFKIYLSEVDKVTQEVFPVISLHSEEARGAL